jgi:hypothetical protein
MSVVCIPRPLHIHGDIVDRLPKHVAEQIDALSPLPDDNVEARASKYRDIEKVIANHYIGVKQDTGGGALHAGTSHCVLHNKRCPLYNGLDESEIRDGVKRELLTMNAAGTSCKDVSPIGKRLGVAGPSMIAFHTWCYERWLVGERVILHENTEYFDSELIAAVLSETHTVYSFIVDSSAFGFPVRRRRRITLALRYDVMLKNDLGELMSTMGGRRLVMTPGAYYAVAVQPSTSDTAKYNSLEQRVIAGNKKRVGHNAELEAKASAWHSEVCGSPAAANHGPQNLWKELLSAGQRARLAEYSSKHTPAFKNKLANKSPESVEQILDSGIIMDLDQNPSARGRIAAADVKGQVLMTQISHGMLWNTSTERPLLSFEHLLCQGVNVMPEVTQVPEAFPAYQMMERGLLSPSQLTSMAGNGWHVPTLGLVVMYVLASVELAADVDKTQGQSSVSQAQGSALLSKGSSTVLDNELDSQPMVA